MLIVITLILAAFIPCASAFRAAPVIVASHKLVRGVKAPKDFYQVNDGEGVTNMIKQLVTECSSDEYIIVDLPGLRLEDVRVYEKDNWHFLRKYLTMASTVVGIPMCGNPIDLGFIEKYIIKTCNAETINVIHLNDEEVNEYHDTRTRVVRVNLQELPSYETERQERAEQIKRYDDLVRKIIRKLPSPHYTLIVTSSTLQPYHFTPKAIVELNPEQFQVFSDIVHEPSRDVEYERNDRFHHAKPDLNAPRYTNDRYLSNKKRDQIHLFDYDLWKKNERLVMTILMMILGLVVVQLASLTKFFLQKITRHKLKTIIHAKGD